MPSLLQRLKERKLFQWALAYLAGAWLVFQGIEVLAEPWNLSEAVQRAIHVLLGIGFLVTLVLAWYHGEKGRQRASGVELLILAGILVIAGAAVAALGRLSPEGEGAIGQQAGADSKIIDAKSVAVLPFDNFSPDPNDAYFADGMQEQLISTLSRISGLSVRGRMSVMRYRDNPKPLPEIAAELGVTFIIEGSARIVGDEVSVTAQLIDAGQDEHLWSEEYDREFSVGNILLIHREIAEHVASQLRTELTPEERERIDSNPTEDAQAYQAYLRGRFWLNTRYLQGINTAVEHFERAVRLDSLFAPAYAGLSDAHSLIPYYFIDADPLVHFPLAEQFARRAIDVDDQAAEGHTSLAVSLLRYGGDYEQSEEEFLRAIDLSPSLVVARKEYSTLLSFLGRHDEAVEEAYRAVELDPLSAIVRAQLGAALQRAGRDVVAISALQEAIRLDPGVRWAWEMMGWTYLHMGRFDKACESLSEAARLDEADPEVARHLCEAARQWVATGRAVPLRPEWVSSQRFHLRGRWLALSGNIEKAVDLWESQVSWLGNLEFWNPLYDNLRDHPRFQALLEKYE